MALALPIRGACRNCGGTTCSQTCFKIQEISKRPPNFGGFLLPEVFIDMKYIISENQLEILLNEAKEPSLSVVQKLFKVLDEEKKKKKKRAEILEVIENLAPYMNIPKEYALYILELYLLNYRKDGDYSGLTKENFVDPRKQSGKTTPNTSAKLYTIAKMPFKGSNLIGRWSKDYKGNPFYEVVSYDWYPVYIFKDDKWYEVTRRYSSSTSRQMENANPVKWSDELEEPVYLLTEKEMDMLKRGMSHEEVMKHKVEALKKFEPELTKRKKTAKSYRWHGDAETANANIKFKINSIEEEGDKATVTVDILDVIHRGDDGEEPTPQNYLKGEMKGMDKEIAEEKVKVKIMGLLRDYMATRFRYNGEDPPIQNIFFKFNHLKK
jgi:hypothetical protein